MIALLLILACDRPFPELDGPGAETGLPAVPMASPADGAVLRDPWTPVVVRLESGDRDADFLVYVDGRPTDDAAGLIRRRLGSQGGGWDFLGWVDLQSLAPGPHEVLVIFDNGPRRFEARSHVTVDRAPHRVTVHVRDDDGAPLDARVVLTDGERLLPVVTATEDADPIGRDRAIHSAFARDGVAVFDLDPGHYRLLAVRSVLHEVGVLEVDLAEDTELDVVLPQTVDLPDHLLADLHVHTGRSYDSFLPDRIRLDSLRAAGLDLAVITDHNTIFDPAAVPEQGGLVAGVEADLRRPGGTGQPRWDLGHMNAFPVLDGPQPDMRIDDPGEAIGRWRARQVRRPYPGVGEEVVLQLNHPRGIHFRPERAPNRQAWPLFDELGFDPEVPIGEGANAWMTTGADGYTVLDFDAIEVINRFSFELYLDMRRDWFAILDHGTRMTGTGNSDSHAFEVEVAGLTVNQVRAPAGDLAAFARALREGRVAVSTGPTVGLTVEGAGRTAEIGDTLRADEVQARIRVQAPSWVPVPEVRLVVDGEVLERWPLPPRVGPLDHELVASFHVERPGWVLAEAGWPLAFDGEQPLVGGDYGLVAPGYVPLAFTNPVWLRPD